jgi:hypothetical protein
MRTTGRTATWVGVLGALLIGGGTSWAHGSAASTVLAPTAHAPTARGRAVFLDTAPNGRLKIAALRLAADATFDVVAGGIKIGSLTTTGGGHGKLRLSTRGHGAEGFLGFDPRGVALAVRGADGDDVLEGTMPQGDPNAVACCLGADGDRCKERTSDACTAAGGTPMDVASCLPDPCGGVAPPQGDNAICCTSDSADGAMVDDDPDVECGQEAASDCAEDGGIVVSATSCHPNPCKPVPPPTVVVCCVPGEGDVECELRTPDHCAEHHGTVSTATSCDPDPCGGSGDAAPSVH